MKFFDREIEFEKLREIEELSQETAQFTIVTGRRRIGKTELVRRFYEGKPLLYFFVARKAEACLCEIFIEEIRTKLNIPMMDAKGTSFATVFRFVMDLAQTQHITLFIDEFQDFYRINPSIYSDMQNIWDSCKNKARINLIVAGSVNTLMNKIFKNKKEPLFGRQTATMHVRPFRPSVMKEIMAQYCPGYKKSDLLALYTLTGGVAKYVELLIDHKKFTEKTMLNMFFERDSYFLPEGKNMLVDEFGKDYGIYFSILTLIAQGKNTRTELENALNIKELSGYLKNLNEEYGLISKQQPLYEKSANKNVHYTIDDQFLSFWFRFVYKYSHIIEAGGNEKLKSIAERDFATVSGKSLEHYFMEVLKEQGSYTRLGYWHDRKGENEIDIIAEDEVEKRLEFIEVKRQSKNFDEDILKSKAASFMKSVGTYDGYEILYKGLSIEDM
ncbi:MAG: ATP-binding protein [Bacteroidetes bacterium]|uniref:ATP-binding protein n=1 Tax=Candidatus Gallipaludibacter merdavium TaxID=2840839 RepID=A0A9D9HVU2_9BACT|nr:ATP-binding protein [Candidatus Gallipaludibacter merdavium]